MEDGRLALWSDDDFSLSDLETSYDDDDAQSPAYNEKATGKLVGAKRYERAVRVKNDPFSYADFWEDGYDTPLPDSPVLSVGEGTSESVSAYRPHEHVDTLSFNFELPDVYDDEESDDERVLTGDEEEAAAAEEEEEEEAAAEAAAEEEEERHSDKLWTKAEIDQLRYLKEVQRLKYKDIAKRMQRTPRSVKGKYMRIKTPVSRTTRWLPEDVENLMRWREVEHRPYRYIAQQLNRQEQAVVMKYKRVVIERARGLQGEGANE